MYVPSLIPITAGEDEKHRRLSLIERISRSLPLPRDPEKELYPSTMNLARA